MSKSQEKSVVKQSKERPRKGCLSEATRSILEAVCNDFQNIGVPDSAEKSGQVNILCDDVEETNEESVIGDVAVSCTASAVPQNTDSEEQDPIQSYSDNEQIASVSVEEQTAEGDNDVSCAIVKLHEKNKENVNQCNSHSSFNVTDASESSQMEFVNDGVCEIIDGSAVATLDRINLLTISAEVVEKSATTSLPGPVTNEDTPVKNKASKNVLNTKSSISASALNSVPSKNHSKVPIITAMTNQPRMRLPMKMSDVSERTKQLCQNKSITVGRKSTVLKMSQSSKPAKKVPPLPPRTVRYSSTRSTLKARRITAKMKQAWALQLQKDGHLTCPVPGCSQSYVTIANLITHYKWCSGKKSLQHCIYCSSLIIADQDAVLHHIKVEHPEKLEEYKEKLPAKHLVERQESTCKGDVDSSQDLPTGKTGLYQTSGNCVAKTLSKKYQRLNKHSKAKLRAKENILKPWKTCLKKKVKIIDEEEPYDKKCVRFNDIVEKIKSVEDKPADQDTVTPAPATTVCNTNTLFSGILENAFLPEEVDDILDITECEDLPPTNYFDLSDEENLTDPDQSQGSSEVTQKKSRCFKVLDTHGFKRFSEYLKLTRDWASERKTYSRSKHGASSDTPTVLQPTTTVEDVVDVHQLHDTPEPSKVSLGASETELNQNEITPYCSIPQEEPNKDSPIFDNLVSQLSDREVAKRSNSVDPVRTTQSEFRAIRLSPDRQVESAVCKEQPSNVQNNSSGSHTAPAVHVNSVNTGYKPPITTPRSYRPLIKVRVTCYDNACKEDAIQNTPFGIEKKGTPLSKPFGAKSPVTLDKTVANLCKSLQTPPPVPDFDSLIKSCVPTTHDASQPAVTVPKKRGRRPKNISQCPSNLAKQLPDAVSDDSVNKVNSVTNQVLAESTKQSNTISPVLGDSLKKTFSIRENGIKLPPGNTVVDGVIVKRKRGRPRKNLLAEQFLPPADGTPKPQAAKTESISTSSRKIVHKCKWCADCDSEYARIIKRKRNSAKGFPGTHIFPGAESLSPEQLAIINTVSSEQVVVSEHLPAVIKYLKAKKKVICSKKVKCKESKLHKMGKKPGRPRISRRTKKVDASTQVSQDIDLCNTSIMEQSNAHTGIAGEKTVNMTNSNESVNVIEFLLGQNTTESLKTAADVKQHASAKSALTSPAASIQMLPRKRGRPRKNALPGVVTSPISPNVMSSSSVVTVSPDLSTQQGFCGDGVAKGHIPNEPQAKDISSPNSVFCTTLPQLTSPVTPKRGRGRPRKFPLATERPSFPVAVINNEIHTTTPVVTSSDSGTNLEKDINSCSPEKDNISEIPRDSGSTVMNATNLNTEERTVSNKELSNSPSEAVQVCEKLDKSSEAVTAVSSSDVENKELQDPVLTINSVTTGDNNEAISACSAGNEVQENHIDVCSSSEVPNNSVVTTVPHMDTSSDTRVENEMNQTEESANDVFNKEIAANELMSLSSSTSVDVNCDSIAVTEFNSSSAVPSISDKDRGEEVLHGSQSDTSNKVNQASASSVTSPANEESAVSVSDTLAVENAAVEVNVCGTEISQSGPTDDAVMGSSSPTEIPREVPADVSVDCASTTKNRTSGATSTPDDDQCKESDNGELTVDSSAVLSKCDAESKPSEDSEVLATKECAVNGNLSKQEACENKNNTNITEVNSSIIPSPGKDSPSTDVSGESPKLPQKTGKRGRPRKYPVGERSVTPKSLVHSDATKHETGTPQQKPPLRTSSRQRSCRRLCIDDTCMDKCHMGFRTPNLKSNSVESGSVTKSGTKSMQHVENVTCSPVPVEISGGGSKNDRNIDVECTLTVGKDEKPESVEERDSQHLISDPCSAVEAEIVKVEGLSTGPETPEDGHELIRVPCDPNPSTDTKVLKKSAVKVSRLPYKVQKVPKRRGRPRKIKSVDNEAVGSLSNLSPKNLTVNINRIESFGAESSNGTGNLVNSAAVGGIPRKCSRKGLPRKCVRYAVINSGVDSDTLEDESLSLNPLQEEDKKTRKRVRLEKNKSSTPEVICDQLNSEPNGNHVVENSITSEHGGESDLHNAAAVEENNKENSITHSNENEMSSCKEQAMSDDKSDKKSKTMKAPIIKVKIKGKKRKRNCEEPSAQEKQLALEETSTEKPSTGIQNTAECMELEVQSHLQPEHEITPENDLQPPSKKAKLTRRAAVKARKMLVGFINAEKSDSAVHKTKHNKDLDYDAALDDKSGNESEEAYDSEDDDVHTELAKFKEFYFVPKPTVREVPRELLEEWTDLLSKGKRIECDYKDCGRTFKSKLGIKDHYINSVCQRRWKCLKCNKFLNAGARRMLRHMLSNHNEVNRTDRSSGTEAGGSRKTFHPSLKKPAVLSDFGAIQWALDFHKKYSCTDLMPKWKPKENLWKLQDSKEYGDYLPPLKKSVNIGIECQDKDLEKWFSLNCFESVPVDSESSHCTFFAGGPIWAAAWCPTPFDVKDAEQFVALATANKMNSDHTVLPATEGKGLVQVWGVGKLKSDMSECKPTLNLAITHDYGTVWDLAWCPFGCWEDPSKCASDEFLPRLGLLAVACSNSSVYIYSIPHPRTLACNTDCLPIFTAHPSVILQCDYGEPCLVSAKSMCTCISWQKTDGCELLAGGFSNGMICVWHLTCESSLLVSCNESLLSTITPFLSIPAHSAAITGLSFSGLPGGRWLSSCGFDRSTKVWDLEDTSLPVSTIPKKLFRSLQWISRWNGLFLTRDDTTNVTLYKECGYYNCPPRILIPHNAGIWSCSVSEWLNTAVSSDAAGEVAGNILCHLFKNVDTVKQLQEKRFPVFRTEIRALKDNSVTPELHDIKESCMAKNQEQGPLKHDLPSDVNNFQNNLDVPAVAASVIMDDATTIVQTVEDISESVVMQHDCSPEITEDHVSQAQCLSDKMSIGKSSVEMSGENNLENHCNDLDVEVVASDVIDEATLVVQTVEDMVQDVVQHADSVGITKDATSWVNENEKANHYSSGTPSACSAAAHQHPGEVVVADLEQPMCSKQNDVKHHLDEVAICTSIVNDATVVVQTMEDVLQGVSQTLSNHENGKANHYSQSECPDSAKSVIVDQFPSGSISVSANLEKLPDKCSEQNVMAVSASVINEATVIVDMLESMLQSIQHASKSEIIIKDQNRKGGSFCELNSCDSTNGQGPNEISVSEKEELSSKCSNQKDVIDSQNGRAVSEVSLGVTNEESIIIQSVENMLQHVCCNVDRNSNISSEDSTPSSNESGEAENRMKSTCSTDLCTKVTNEEISITEELTEVFSEQSSVSSVVSDLVNEVIAVVQTMKDILKNLNVNGSSEISVRHDISHGHEKGIVDNDPKPRIPMDAKVQSVAEVFQDCKVVVEDICLKTESYFNDHNESDSSVWSRDFIADSNIIFSADIVKLVQEMISNVMASSDKVYQNSNKIETGGTSSKTISSDFKNTTSEKLLQKHSAESFKENISSSSVNNKQSENLGISENNSGLAVDIVTDIVESLLRITISDVLPKDSHSVGVGEHINAVGALNNNNVYQIVSSVLNSVLKKVVDMPSCYTQTKTSDRLVQNTPLEPSCNSVQEGFIQSEFHVMSQDVFVKESCETLEKVDKQTEKLGIVDHQTDTLNTTEDEEMEIDVLEEDISQSAFSDEQNSLLSMEEDAYSNIGSVDFIVVDEASCEMEDDSSLDTKDSSVPSAENDSSMVDIPGTVGDSLNPEMSILETTNSDPCLDMETVSTEELCYDVEGNVSSETSDVHMCKESNQLTDASNESKLGKSLSADNYQVCPDMPQEGVSHIGLEPCGLVKLNISVMDLNCVKETVEDTVSHVADKSFTRVPKNISGDGESSMNGALSEENRTATISQSDTMQCIEDTVESIVSFVSNSSPNVRDVYNDVPEPSSVVCETNVNSLEPSHKPVVICSAAEHSSAVTASSDSETKADTLWCVEETVKDIVSLVSTRSTDVFEKDTCSEIVESSNEICESSVGSAHLSEKEAVSKLPSFDMTASQEIKEETLQCVDETLQNIVSLVSCTPTNTSENDICTEMSESSGTISETNVISLQPPEEVVMSSSNELPTANMITSGDAEMGGSELCAVSMQTEIPKNSKRVHALVETVSDAPPPKKLKMSLGDEEHTVPNLLCDSNITSCQRPASVERIPVSDPFLEGETNIPLPVNNPNVCNEVPPSSSCLDGRLSDSVVCSENSLPQDLCGYKETNDLDILDKYESISKGYGLFFKDADLHNFRGISESEIKRLKKSECMTSTIPDRYDLASVNTVKWNPNYGSHLWLFTGGQAGIARLSLVKALDGTQTTDCKSSKKPLQKR